MSRNTLSARGDRRGVSPVVAVVLLVGLVAVGSIGILLIAGTTTENTQENAETERVEKGFQQLDRGIDTVARGETTTRKTDLDLPDTGDSAVREDDTGRIWINRTNYTTGTTDVIVDEPIGAIRYTTDGGETIGIQSGGVWKEEGNRTRMVSPPAFSYKLNGSGDNPTLTVPIVVTSGSQRLENGDVRIQRKRSVAPTNDVTVFEGELVRLAVKSQWYVGWADYFRQIAPSGGVTVDHENRTATLELVVPLERGQVVAGIVSGASAETLEINNNADINSYNSSVSSCDRCSGAGKTKVIAAGDVNLNNNVALDGDLTAGGDVRFNHPGATVTGNASYGGDLYDSSGSIESPTASSHVGGWHNDNASVIEYEPVDGVIDSRVARASQTNNNSANPHISGNSLGSCSPECTLYSGTYYVDDLSLSGTEKIVFETDGGEVNLVVDGPATFTGSNSVKLEVDGPGRVNIYVNSTTPGSDDLYWQQSDTEIPGDRSSQLWVYMKQDADATFEGGQTDFYGVVFGPGDGANDGTEITVGNQAWIYGALVGKVDVIDNQAHVVFDESLTNADTISSSVKVPKLSFLHASLHEVCVQSSSNASTAC